ncbi:hypothetical protein UPYG_G00209970 [Umbra pygmaea]|uniref:Polyadenylate-binding protein-interacting protein 2 n=1 Tax=Umbra pygmaea TaxID=75934 RepID=A0ABD0WJJ7_UMBPY
MQELYCIADEKPTKSKKIRATCHFFTCSEIRLRLTAKMKDPSRINNTPRLSNIDIILHGLNDENPFAEYMWMENEEEFNRQVEEEFWEEEFIEQCFQEMLEEEENEWFIPARDLPPTLSQMQNQLHLLVLGDTGIADGLAVNSNLNPEAEEFVPRLKH